MNRFATRRALRLKHICVRHFRVRHFLAVLLGTFALLAAAQVVEPAGRATRVGDAVDVLAEWHRHIQPRFAPFLHANFPDSADKWSVRLDETPDADDPASAYIVVLRQPRLDRLRRLSDALALAADDASSLAGLKLFIAGLRDEAATGAAASPFEPQRDASRPPKADSALRSASRVLFRDAVETEIAIAIAQRLLADEARRAPAAPSTRLADIDELAYALLAASRSDSLRGVYPGFFVHAALDERRDAPVLGSVAFACRMLPVLRRDTRGLPADMARGIAAATSLAGSPSAACSDPWQPMPPPARRSVP